VVSAPTLIFETLHGSRAYGLAREGSDTDLEGVVVPTSGGALLRAGVPMELESDVVACEMVDFLATSEHYLVD
jgi:predicted nucleotidyltransferase